MTKLIGTMVYVGLYTHEHGNDLDVYTSEEAAWMWADRIVANWWQHEMSKGGKDVPMPEDLSERRRMYFEETGEDFEVIATAIKS